MGLKQTKISDVTKDNKIEKIVTVKESDTVNYILNVLSDNKISSAPVLGEDGKTVVGFIDFLDIVTFLVQKIKEPRETRYTISSSLHTDDMATLQKRAEEFNAKTVIGEKLINLSKVNPFCRVESSKTLDDVMAYFSVGVHRVAVTNEVGGPPETLLSQTDVLCWLNQDPKRLGELKDKTVDELKLGSSHFSRVSEKSSTVDAFFEMNRKNVSGVAVVDEFTGALKGNLSASDLKGILKYKMEALLWPVNQYCDSVKSEKDKEKLSVTTVLGSTPLDLVITKFAETRAHRIYVVDEKTHIPLRAIYPTNIFKLFEQN